LSSLDVSLIIIGEGAPYVTRDIDKQSQMRIMQSNLTGAAGLVSLEDGCINEFEQRGTRADPQSASFMEMDGRKVESEKEFACDEERGARLLARLSRDHGVLTMADTTRKLTSRPPPRARAAVLLTREMAPRRNAISELYGNEKLMPGSHLSVAAGIGRKWPYGREGERDDIRSG
jgi:hypothetical protein